ncbi:Protein-L-isoaspartate O-methyltransferase [Carbonactinospora thermoautotrophica]|uniref:Protein-L-isoaspartate O-methyltransferase n=1 Tax=Carbonactinospora thermoautotrophica TaxID=1469144 RepID=A0A132MN91_9ACTN|nr:erythromycin esterase family protein [Carbonactinospora thermoautotrophica]KWW99318.1 Protein-L-isoaspartate O-methyltransferase [Carbonactinospora thermoautotrophica]
MSGRLDDMRGLALPLTEPSHFDPLLERIGDARYVLLGEASHGTHEYYRWRAALTRRLIEELGFSFVAVEGDWPGCFRIHCSVTHRSAADPRAALDAFSRWPTWMWANEEVVAFCQWLREYNAEQPAEVWVGFFGLDVYSLWDSLRSALGHVRDHVPEYLDAALAACRCFEPYCGDPHEYARAGRLVPDSCEDEVAGMLCGLRERAVAQESESPLASLAAWQDAEVAAGAGAYYRAMVRGGPGFWNIRDTHMADTLDRLVGFYGPDVKAVVWEHNTHVGDARFTDMARRGLVNVGQLVRERHGRVGVVLVGFGSHRGTVIAGDGWGAPMRVMEVPPARAGSLEDLLHATGLPEALYVFPPRDQQPGWLTGWLDHRAIGVVYQPEQGGDYAPTRLGSRYDAFCWFDETSASRPLHAERVGCRELEAFPTGV